MNVIYYFFIFWYINGLILVGFNILPPWLEWSNAVFLYMTGILGWIYMVKRLGRKLGNVFSILVLVLSMFGEWLGVRYGILFGQYAYGDAFGLKLFNVPLTIGFAWLMVIATSHAILKDYHLSFFSYSLLAGLLAVSLDLILDPVCGVAKQYWTWEGSSIYYDIPLQNFSGWFIVAFLLQTILYVLPKQDETPLWDTRLKRLYLMMLFFFCFIGLLEQLYMAIIISVVVTILTIQGGKWLDRSKQK